MPLAAPSKRSASATRPPPMPQPRVTDRDPPDAAADSLANEVLREDCVGEIVAELTVEKDMQRLLVLCPLAAESGKRIRTIGRPRTGDDVRLTLQTDVEGQHARRPGNGSQVHGARLEQQPDAVRQSDRSLQESPPGVMCDRTSTAAIFSSKSASRFSSSDLAAATTRSVTSTLKTVTLHWSRRSLLNGATEVSSLLPRSAHPGVTRRVVAIATESRGRRPLIPHDPDTSAPSGALYQPFPWYSRMVATRTVVPSRVISNGVRSAANAVDMWRFVALRFRARCRRTCGARPPRGWRTPGRDRT